MRKSEAIYNHRHRRRPLPSDARACPRGRQRTTGARARTQRARSNAPTQPRHSASSTSPTFARHTRTAATATACTSASAYCLLASGRMKNRIVCGRWVHGCIGMCVAENTQPHCEKNIHKQMARRKHLKTGFLHTRAMCALERDVRATNTFKRLACHAVLSGPYLRASATATPNRPPTGPSSPSSPAYAPDDRRRRCRRCCSPLPHQRRRRCTRTSAPEQEQDGHTDTRTQKTAPELSSPDGRMIINVTGAHLYVYMCVCVYTARWLWACMPQRTCEHTHTAKSGAARRLFARARMHCAVRASPARTLSHVNCIYGRRAPARCVLPSRAGRPEPVPVRATPTNKQTKKQHYV